MSGKVEHLGGDRWRVRLYMGTDPVTKRKIQRTRTFRANGVRAAERAAVKHKAALEVERDRMGEYVGSVSNLIDRYLANKTARDEWSPSTAKRNADIFAVVVADLGHHQLATFSAAHVDEWFNLLLERGLSPLTIRQYRAWLQAALRQGRKWKMCSDEATRDSTLPRHVGQEVTPPTNQVVQLLFNAATGRLHAALAVVAYTGLRRGEVVGLRWADFRDGKLYVTRNVLNMPDGKVHVKAPKSQRPRDFKVSPSLLDELAPLRAEALAAFNAFDIEVPADWFVFADLRKDPTGQTPVRPDWLSGAWTRHRTTHQAETVKLHHLRHWHLSTLGAAGVPGVNLQRRGGHADLSTTGIYTHALAAGEDKTDGVIEAALNAPKRKARRITVRRPAA